MIYRNKTIKKKGNRYYVRYRENGKQIYLSAKTQRECLQLIKNELGIIDKKKPKETTLIEWYKEWLNLFKIKNVKSETVKDYEKSLRHIPDSIKNKTIKKIKSIEIIEILNKIEASRARQKVYELLNALYNKAYLHGVVSQNIMNIIDKPKHTSEKGYALNKKEQKLFLESCDNFKRGIMFKIMLHQGLRIGEILAITYGDIDLKNKKIDINKSINANNEFDETKDRSDRIIPMFNKTFKIFNQLKGFTSNKNARIFNITYSTAEKSLTRIVKSANITNISTHDLRHTFITNCKNENIPEHIIQSWVGHEIGSKVTSKIYTHVNEEVSNEYFNKLNNSDLFK